MAIPTACWSRLAPVRLPSATRRPVRCAGRPGTAHDGAGLQRSAGTGRRVREAWRPNRRRHRRAGRRQHEPDCSDAGIPQGHARSSALEAWRRADIRRSDDRLPCQPEECAGPVRHHARLVHLRQGDRRRYAARRLRRPARHHGADRSARTRCIRPVRCPATRSPRRPAWPRSRLVQTPGFYERTDGQEPGRCATASSAPERNTASPSPHRTSVACSASTLPSKCPGHLRRSAGLR
jgi:hypothetical protein